MKDVGERLEGEPHEPFDGEGLETDMSDHRWSKAEAAAGNPRGPYAAHLPSTTTRTAPALHLLVRRMPVAWPLLWPVAALMNRGPLELLHHYMESGMLKGIKERAEAAHSGAAG